MASGYDFSSFIPFRLMKGRLGVYDKQEFIPELQSVAGVSEQFVRLKQHGGNR